MQRKLDKSELRLCDRGGCGAGILWVFFVVGCFGCVLGAWQMLGDALTGEVVRRVSFPIGWALIAGYFLFRRPRTKEEKERRGRCE